MPRNVFAMRDSAVRPVWKSSSLPSSSTSKSQASGMSRSALTTMAFGRLSGVVVTA